MSTKLVKCDCKSAYQDAEYGKQQRVANAVGATKARCTVCLKEHTVNEPKAK